MWESLSAQDFSTKVRDLSFVLRPSFFVLRLSSFVIKAKCGYKGNHIYYDQNYNEVSKGNSNYSSAWGTRGTNIKYYNDTYLQQYVTGRNYPNNRNDFIINGNHLYGTTSEITAFFNSAQVREVGDIRILTREIVMPVDNPDYTSGDGMTIIDGQPTYEELTFSGEVTNLPAIVSTGTIENPEVDQIYTNIPAFFQMAGDTMNGFKQILFRMPDEVLIAIYAVLAVGVIFGFLRIMREH